MKRASMWLWVHILAGCFMLLLIGAGCITPPGSRIAKADYVYVEDLSWVVAATDEFQRIFDVMNNLRRPLFKPGISFQDFEVYVHRIDGNMRSMDMLLMYVPDGTMGTGGNYSVSFEKGDDLRWHTAHSPVEELLKLHAAWEEEARDCAESCDPLEPLPCCRFFSDTTPVYSTDNGWASHRVEAPHTRYWTEKGEACVGLNALPADVFPVMQAALANHLGSDHVEQDMANHYQAFMTGAWKNDTLLTKIYFDRKEVSDAKTDGFYIVAARQPDGHLICVYSSSKQAMK